MLDTISNMGASTRTSTINELLPLMLGISPKKKENPISFVIVGDKISLVIDSDDLEDKLEESLQDEISLEERAAYEASEARAVDYEALFNYKSTIKENDYSSNTYFIYDAPKATEDQDFFHPKFDDETINEILRAAKIRNQLGIEVYVNPMKKSLFDVWKLANSSDNKIRYDMVSI
ncbi:MAG: hypothetical protein V1837_00370 [Candidatus Woesearchaeota archaeon]